MTNPDSVASLSLKTRTYNSLAKGRFSAPISTISELVQLSEDDLYKRRGMGPGTVAEIKASLAERGLSLSPPQHPTNEELLDYAFGQPSIELVERIEKHLNDCGECAQTVARLVRAVVKAQEPPDAV